MIFSTVRRSTVALSVVMPLSVTIATALSLSLKALKPSLTGDVAMYPAKPTKNRMVAWTAMMSSVTLALGLGFLRDMVEESPSCDFYKFWCTGTAHGIEQGFMQRLDASVDDEVPKHADDTASDDTSYPDDDRQVLIGQQQATQCTSHTKYGHNPATLLEVSCRIQ